MRVVCLVSIVKAMKKRQRSIDRSLAMTESRRTKKKSLYRDSAQLYCHSA